MTGDGSGPSAVATAWLERIRTEVGRVVDPHDDGVITTDDHGDDAVSTVRFATTDEVPEVHGAFSRFSARLGEVVADGDTLHVGLGDLMAGPPGRPVEQARTVAARAGRHLPADGCRVGIPAECEPVAAALIDGLRSGCTTPGRTRLLVDGRYAEAARTGRRQADTARLAATLTSAPPNVLTPKACAGIAEDIAQRAGLDCEIFGPDEVSRRGFGGLAAIGAGSAHGPHLVRLTYRPERAEACIALVGKGITFGSGGLSLKPPGAMQTMRMDMAGAAAILAVMAALAVQGCSATVHAILPFAENLPGAGAARPGDIVTAWNGIQIQLLDTDFEGRVVLADGLALASSLHPDLVVDLATLTNAAVVALGPEVAAVIGRDQGAVDAFLAAAAEAGEPMWQLPWAERYLDQVRTPFGVRNHPLADTGRALTAALFLGEFVPADLPWVHCDLAGPAWRGTASEEGGTGFATRTLLTLLRDQG
ncbi:Leucyl aminopeptidase (fragment) [Nostocoides japonicum T1-X7]|uniref:Probable cytosol aminopeptidase n=1 Tax=Nostocoides japonicum T1-X7 TaxID=1194083 RepID=A0A077LX60_9MICO